jgi:hypothetical protein
VRLHAGAGGELTQITNELKSAYECDARARPALAPLLWDERTRLGHCETDARGLRPKFRKLVVAQIRASGIWPTETGLAG